MVARLFPAAHIDINAASAKHSFGSCVEQQVVHSQAGAFVVASPKREIPIGVDTLLRMNFAQGVGPAFRKHESILIPAFREEHCIENPAFRYNRINVRGHDIVVAT